MRRLRSLALASVGVVAALLAACGSGEEKKAEGAPAAGSINLYTSRHYDSDLALYEAFTRETGIKINRLEMRPDQLIERMKAEGDASPADVILMADAGALWRAEQAGLLQPVTSTVLTQRVPANLRDPEGEWYGFARRARVFAFDPTKVSADSLRTYEDLANPRLRGQVCVRAADNVYNLSLMSALIERWGRAKALEWAKGVVANMARPPQGGDIDQIKAVGAGACSVALTNTYYYLRLARSEDAADKAAADKTRLAFPDLAGNGTHVNVSGGGVARHAANRDGAIKFLEFMTTPEAQAIFAGGNNEYPAAIDAPVPAPLQPYANFKADPLPVSVYGARQAEAQAVFDEAGWR